MKVLIFEVFFLIRLQKINFDRDSDGKLSSHAYILVTIILIKQTNTSSSGFEVLKLVTIKFPGSL